MPELKAKITERVERYVMNGEEIEALIKEGFMQAIFLGGQPGDAQTIDFTFNLDRYSGAEAVAVVTTREVG